MRELCLGGLCDRDAADSNLASDNDDNNNRESAPQSLTFRENDAIALKICTSAVARDIRDLQSN